MIPWVPPGVIPEGRTESNPWALPGVVQKPNPKKTCFLFKFSLNFKLRRAKLLITSITVLCAWHKCLLWDWVWLFYVLSHLMRSDFIPLLEVKKQILGQVKEFTQGPTLGGLSWGISQPEHQALGPYSILPHCPWTRGSWGCPWHHTDWISGQAQLLSGLLINSLVFDLGKGVFEIEARSHAFKTAEQHPDQMSHFS